MADDFSDLKSFAEMAVEYLNLLVDSTKNLADAQKETNEAIKENTQATTQLTTAKKEEKKSTDNLKSAKDKLTSAGKTLGNEFIKMTDAGIRFASAIGTQATNGVRLELQNRLAAVKQIISLDANRAASLSQIQAAEQSLADTFVSVRDGLQLSSEGAAQFANNLKGGFRSEFQLTNESLRALVTTGLSTTEQFESFRRASGRASLSSGQFANIVNKNTLSFLLYGQNFAKAAVNAEKLGISLAGVQAAQEGLVTNLDGTIDTVAQLNQLGAQVDFGTLIRVAEQDGPDALLAYVRRTVPEQLMQSASTRSLFKQLGISVEDYMKMGNKQASAAEDIESQMTEAAKATGMLSNTATILNRLYNTGTATFAGLITATGGAILALNAFSTAAIASGAATLGKAATIASLGLRLISGAAVGAGAGMVAGGSATASTVGSIAGSLGAAALARFAGGAIGTFFGGPVGAMLGGALGGLAGAGIERLMADDMFSAGYGSRMLVTPKGAFALNNADDIIAGTNLFPKGSLRAGSDNSDLVRKVDALVTALSNASTTINVGGTMQTVPRMQLVGVYSRNEVR
jgi:hypothetical protein